MPYCYYTCNLLPLDLVVRAGYSPRWLGSHLRDLNAPARRDALSVHPMTCPYVTKLVAAAEEVMGSRSDGAARTGAAGGSASGDASATADCLVVPGGCDAMRRLGDLMAATYPERVFVLPMPRSSGPAVISTLAVDLARLEEWLNNRLPADDRPQRAAGTSAGAAASVAAAEPPTLDYPTPPRPGGVFLVAGPLSDDSLLCLIDRLGAHVSGLECCTSPDRWKPLAPSADGAAADGKPGGAPTNAVASGDSDHKTLAAHVLATGMCPRRSTAARRDHLTGRLDEAHPSSIIYARQSFCDPGAYDSLLVALLAQERNLPFLEIEVDFPFDANGPLRTRVEAFLEAQLLDDDLLDGDDLFDDGKALPAPAAEKG